ncbi:LigA [Anaeromyxobacter dehalogenans 2CP-C]|uniref:LigA n=1 Tax=Anaeromyxobacter dehalogenans (strain 2CP-C) TaxID=290397 RepID=Q2II13_ANADE|nr:LigA [Anaeromyxobacter dehalogenans 2CP-C]
MRRGHARVERGVPLQRPERAGRVAVPGLLEPGEAQRRLGGRHLPPEPRRQRAVVRLDRGRPAARADVAAGHRHAPALEDAAQPGHGGGGHLGRGVAGERQRAPALGRAGRSPPGHDPQRRRRVVALHPGRHLGGQRRVGGRRGRARAGGRRRHAGLGALDRHQDHLRHLAAPREPLRGRAHRGEIPGAVGQVDHREPRAGRGLGRAHGEPQRGARPGGQLHHPVRRRRGGAAGERRQEEQGGGVRRADHGTLLRGLRVLRCAAGGRAVH